MICPVCHNPIRPTASRKRHGVAHHKGCAVWQTMPTHFVTNGGEVLPVEVIKLNVRSARVKVRGQDKIIRVTKASGKLRRLK